MRTGQSAKRSTKVGVVLLSEQRGRDQHGDLLAGLHCDECGAQRDLGLAEADVAADHAVHGLAGLEVAQHLLDRGRLIGGFLEREARLKCPVFGFARRHLRALPCGAARIQIQQFRGDVADALSGLAPRLLPLLAAELVQRCCFRRRAGVARDQVQSLHGNVQLVAVRIVEHQKLARVACDVHGLEACVAADPVGLVHHRRADAQVRQLLEYLRRIALGPPAPAFLPRAIAEQLSFRENFERRSFQPQARHRGRHRNAEIQGAGDETRKIVEYPRLNVAAAQQIEQQFPPPGRFGGEQNARRAGADMRRQFGCRLLGARIDAHRGRRGAREILHGSLRLGRPFEGVQLNQGAARVGSEEFRRRQIQLRGIQNRPVAVVAQLLVALARCRSTGQGRSRLHRSRPPECCPAANTRTDGRCARRTAAGRIRSRRVRSRRSRPGRSPAPTDRR